MVLMNMDDEPRTMLDSLKYRSPISQNPLTKKDVKGFNKHYEKMANGKWQMAFSFLCSLLSALYSYLMRGRQGGEEGGGL
jgi:hypothetical protein